MKIVMVARHCCIRVQKMAIPLIKKGHKVHVIANKMPSFGDQYESVLIYNSHEQLEASLKLHEDADVFHVHNEPSWYVTVIKQALGDVPVVLDVHDSMLVRVKPDDPDISKTRVSMDERNNFQLADGLNFVNEPMADLVRDEFKLEQPFCVLPSYVPEGLYRVDPWKWLGGVVYEGRVDLPSELSKDMEFFKYCDYTELAQKFKDEDMSFNLYTPRQDEAFKQHYKDIAIWRGSLPYDSLIRQIGRHDWGLVGNITPHPAWDMALPNKLFEYIAAGVPVVAMNAPLCEEFVVKHGVGIAVKSVEELKERWKEHRKCRKQIAVKGKQFAMEHQIHRLEELYENVLGGKKAYMSQMSDRLPFDILELDHEDTLS